MEESSGRLVHRGDDPSYHRLASFKAAVKLLHALYAMLKRREPSNPHVSSSRRRQLGLDISWDVSLGMACGSLAERINAR